MSNDETDLFVVKIGGLLNLGGTVISCPECGHREGLIVAAHRYDLGVMIECPERHKWTTYQVAGNWVYDLLKATEANPDGPIFMKGIWT